MAHATRFDLSRLEGCTGTLAQGRVASPRGMTIASDRSDQDERDRDGAGGADGAADTNGTFEHSGTGGTPSDATAPQRGSAAAQALRSLECPAPASGPATAGRGDQRRHTGAAQRSQEDGDAGKDRLGFGLILALTLSAWIPVLWILTVWA